MAIHFVLALWGLMVGQAEKAPKPGAEADRPPVRVVLLGKQNYKAEDGRAPLVLQIDTGGNVIERFDVTDEMLKKWVSQHCKGHDKASIVIAVGLPEKTSIRAVEKAIEKVNNFVPKETKATFWVTED
jgi:hypothetical protein